MSEQFTRPLTEDESERLVRDLTVALGVNGKDQALRVIAEAGVGIFAVTPS